MQRREVLRTFHHRLGFAVRALRKQLHRSEPLWVKEVMQTQLKVRDEYVKVNEETSCKWPPWKRKATPLGGRWTVTDTHPLDRTMCATDVQEEEALSPRKLQPHISDPSTRFDSACSDTVSWASASHDSLQEGLGAPKRSNHKPRLGRRQKARARQEEMQRCMQQSFRESQFEMGCGNGMEQLLGALVESWEDEGDEPGFHIAAARSSSSSELSLNQACSGEDDVDGSGLQNDGLPPGLHPLFIKVRVAAEAVPQELCKALLDFGVISQTLRPHSLATLRECIASIAPLTAQIEAATSLEWDNAAADSPTHKAFINWLISEPSGPRGLLRKMEDVIDSAASPEMSEELAASNVFYELEDVRFCIKHCWRRLIEDLKVVQFVIERQKLAQRQSPVHEPRQVESQAASRQRAEINEMNQCDIQTLLSQRLLSSQASRR